VPHATPSCSLAFLALALGACNPTPPVPAPLSAADSAALRELGARDAEWVRARDWATLVALYEEGAVRLPPNGPALHGRAANRAWLEQLPPIAAFDFPPVAFAGQGGLAYMHAAWTITVAPPGAPPASDSGKILIVFRKQADGSWLRVADAWNSDLPPAR
jgi:ketosteroid isomerase-like protein